LISWIRFQTFFQVFGVAAFVNEAELIERVRFNFVVEQIGKRPTAPAAKTVSAHVVAASPEHDRAHGGFDAF
jgi:hypothetical protein